MVARMLVAPISYQNSSDHFRYRPEIDGLRALAVVPVVLYHAGVSVFSGGYVGVDIFFVISGYLITRILLSAIDDGTYSIAGFYKRRIRRIFPALLLVLFTTIIAAWIILPPDRLVDFGASVLTVASFSSNFHFWKSVGYFTNNAHVQPLLHTWSLAVEEQFYIFYPPMLYLLSRLRTPLQSVLLVIGTVSLVGACVLIYVMPGAVFYLLPFRAWELVVGGLIAARAPERQFAPGAEYLAVAAMVLPMLLYGPATPFPGAAALPPVLGAALLIWSKDTAVHRVLSTKTVVLIGKASYSFYLWHFPLFAFTAYLTNRPLDAVTGTALSAASLVLALITLRVVEGPTRKAKSEWAIAASLALMVVVGVVGWTLSHSNGFPSRLSPAALRIIDASADKTRHHSECMSSGYTVVVKPCILGVNTQKPTALLWGDSHAMVTATAMEVAAKRAGSSFLFLATADCPPGLGFRISPDFEPDLSRAPAYQSCAGYNQRMLELAIGDPDIRSVVISSRWSNWRIGEPPNTTEAADDLRLADHAGAASSKAENARIFEAGFRRLVQELERHGKRLFIVGPIAEPSFDVPQAMYVSRFGFSKPPALIPNVDFALRHRHALQILSRTIAGAHLIQPQQLLCSFRGCPLMRNGRPTYLDHNHLTVPEARRTAPLYVDVFSATGRDS